jgi:hypothetical protein
VSSSASWNPSSSLTPASERGQSRGKTADDHDAHAPPHRQEDLADLCGSQWPSLSARWLAAFLFGAVLGRAGVTNGALTWLEMDSWYVGLPVIPLTIVAILVIARLTRRRSIAALGVAAVAPVAAVFGLVHAAPAPSRAFDEAVVSASSLGCVGSGPLLVATSEGVFEATGPRQSGAWGALRPSGGGRLLAPRRGTFSPTFTPSSSLVTAAPCALFIRPLRSHMARLARKNAGAAEGWYRGLVLGDADGLPVSVVEDCKRLGVYHLLVVSGLHVTLMAWLLGAALRLPLQVAYAARWVSPRAWRRVAVVMAVVGSLAAWCYLLATGASAASQRASFLYVVVVLTRVACGTLPLGRRMLVAAVCQTLVYPIGFLSEGNLMSWTAYLLVAQAASAARGGLWAQLVAAAWLQLRLTIGAGAVFGQVAWLGLPANALFVPAFPVLLTSALVVLTTESPTPIRLSLGIHQGFVVVIRRAASLCDHFDWLYLAGDDVAPAVRAALVVVAAWTALIAVRGLSIRSR